MPEPQKEKFKSLDLAGKFFSIVPDAGNAAQQVSFGTSGHRGTALNGTFNEAHILAISQAICEYRASKGIAGPLFIGKDTHLLSGPAEGVAVEVFCANGVRAVIQEGDGYTPTPVISRAILVENQSASQGIADGVVITPSHNPPEDGGFKYNPPDGGPADTAVTGWIQNRANELLRAGNSGVKRTASPAPETRNFVDAYVKDLGNVIDMDAIRASGLRIGVDPLGGASLGYWQMIGDRWGLDLSVVNKKLDPSFSFMPPDHDGKIRMDCSSPWAMANLVKLKDDFDIAWGNDPDADRHGIVTPSVGLMNPNYYLAVAIRYLLGNRPEWSASAKVGKTLVSSSFIDKVVAEAGRTLWEVPVGFKWFAPGLFDGTCCFGGEESAGASFLRRNGSVWSTDKDGLILGLLSAEITAKSGRDAGEHYQELTAKYGPSFYTRVDTAATKEQKVRLGKLSADAVQGTMLAGEPIVAKLTTAPGNGAPIGGLKVATEHGWFAARPSGTEDIYKLYAESLKSAEHLGKVLDEAREMVGRSL